MSTKTYQSKYTDKKVTDAQYLTDFIMERIASKENKTLSWKYWNNIVWKKIFLRQLSEANKLLKGLHLIHIMAFLRSKSGQKIYSLGLKSTIRAGAEKFIVVVQTKKEDLVVEKDSFVIEEGMAYIDFSKGKTQWEILNG